MIKSQRQKINMRYSPLVERYLLTHSYETMNNVKGRKMLLTQRHEAQKEVDKKFKAYSKIAKDAEEQSRRLDAEYEQVKAEILKELRENISSGNAHIKQLEEIKKDLVQNGGCAEHSNMIVSC